MKRAIEEGDVNAQADAQSILARASLDAERAKIQKEQLELQAQKFQQAPEPTPPTTQEAPPPPDPKATAWAEKNEWFGKDEAMTYTAFAILDEKKQRMVYAEGFIYCPGERKRSHIFELEAILSGLKLN